MKKIVIKNISLGSVFWLFSGMFLVVGFIMALFGGGFMGEPLRQSMRSIPFVGTLFTGFLGALVFGLINGVISGLMFSLLAALYNIFAMILGGIHFDVEEKD